MDIKLAFLGKLHCWKLIPKTLSRVTQFTNTQLSSFNISYAGQKLSRATTDGLHATSQPLFPTLEDLQN